MQSNLVDLFFSCSFADGDEAVNEYFLAICRALYLQPSNVSTGSASTPPNEAKAKIEAAQALLAVCTRRQELKSGGFIMPGAVHDEISFAFASDTPVLMIIEDGVDQSGFKSNFGTYLSFKREDLFTSVFLQKAVEAIYKLRLFVT